MRTKNFYRRLLSFSIVSLLLVLPEVASAKTLQQKLSRYQQQYNHLDSEQKQQKQQEESSAARAAGLQQSIQNLNQLISSNAAEIARAQGEIQTLNSQEKELTRQKQEHMKELGSLLRTDYEAGSSGYLAFLLGARNWSDLFDRWDEVNYIVKRYTLLQQEIAALSAQIVAKTAAVEDKKKQLGDSIQSEQTAKQTIQESVNKEKALMLQFGADEKTTLEAKSKAEVNISYVQGLIRQQEIDSENAKSHPISGGSGGTSIARPAELNGSVEALISYAEGYTGVPYLWGGTTPAGFDCSGYVQYVFHHFGIDLARTSEEQYTEGVPVSKDDLKPGDIVFFSTYAPGPSHDGIYIGNDTMIDAENRGVLVTHLFGSPYWGPRYIGARRMIKR